MRLNRNLLINVNLLFLAIITGAAVLVIAYRVVAVTFSVLILLLAAMLVAFLLSPLVTRLEGLGVPRVPAVLLVYVALLALIFGLGSLLIVPLAEQIGSLAGNLPRDTKHLRKLLGRADLFLAHHSIPIHLESLQNEGLATAQRIGKDLLGNTLDIVQTVSHIVIDIIAVLVISLYLLIDGPRLRHNILRVVPDGQRSNALFVEASVRTVIGGYVRGQLLLAITIGLMASTGCFILGVHYPLVIGLAAGFFELIPMLGPILGAIPAIGIAAFQSVQLAIATAILFVIIQQLEAHLIAPRIIGHAVGVHPIVAILAVLLGSELDGAFGALVAVPVAGILYVMAQASYSYFTDQHHAVTVVRRRPLYIRWLRQLRTGETAVTEGDDTVTVTVDAPTDQLASIVHERDILAAEYDRVERETRAAEDEEEEQEQSEHADEDRPQSA